MQADVSTAEISVTEDKEERQVVFCAHLSNSVHHSMSSLPFIRTGKCWSFPCLMELERVVMVRTFPNYKTNTKVRHVQPGGYKWDHSPSMDFKPLPLCRAPDSPAAPACPSQRHTAAWSREKEPRSVSCTTQIHHQMSCLCSVSYLFIPGRFPQKYRAR